MASVIVSHHVLTNHHHAKALDPKDFVDREYLPVFSDDQR